MWFWSTNHELDNGVCFFHKLRSLINGEPTSFFNCKKGLRQGCPMSPLLFILMMEGLSLALNKAKAEGSLTGIKVSSNINILLLLFVDDILILSKASLSEWKVIQGILQDFCKASGMFINAQKSIILHTNVNIDSLKSITDVFSYPSKDLELGFHYLGYYLKLDNYRAVDWNWLLEKFEARINHWGNKLLSLGGPSCASKGSS
jgi:hypothetical protein